MLTMTRPCKRKNEDPNVIVDKIIELPSEVLDKILVRLPIRDAVRTGTLSRQWRYLWTKIPLLVFGESFFKEVLENKFLQEFDISTIINGVLLLHNGPIRGFALVIPFYYSKRIPHINHWLQVLSRSGIHAFMLINAQRDPYELPSHLFSCIELRDLRLSNCIFRAPSHGFSGLQHLVIVSFSRVTFASITLDTLLSACPLLENLGLLQCLGFQRLHISIPRLKILIIQDIGNIKSISFGRHENLIHLSMHLSPQTLNFGGGISSNVIDLLSLFPRMERLCFCVKFLTADRNYMERLPSFFNHLKILKLKFLDFSDMEQIFCSLCLIRSCPNLKELAISSDTLSSDSAVDLIVKCMTVQYSICCTLRNLSTVKIKARTGFKGELELVKFLLANSPSLVNLTFKVSGIRNDKDVLLSISQQLLRFQRASPTAEIIFSCEG